ncbi:13763_t:CDS:2 [Entrophospora sp. SA101]|nr:13763_t:CDS:2 [Entrophospora sp. SA101]
MDFDVKYRPGKTNIAADALSRLSHLTNISSVSVQFDNEVNWEQAYSNDSYFSHIWNTLNKNNLESVDPKQQAKIKYFELIDGKIYLKDGKRLAIPSMCHKDKVIEFSDMS